jgi:5'(3')-deoxyribonucleotidase
MKRIAIDLDDTLVETVDLLVKEMIIDEKYSAFKGYHSILDFSKEEELELYKYIRSKINQQDIIKFKPIVGAKPAIKKLSKKYELYIITARTKDVKKHTRKWVKHHFPNIFKKIIFSEYVVEGNFVKTKGVLCKENNISLLIDDNKENILDAHKEKIKTIVFDYKGKYPWSNIKNHSSIPVAKSWSEVLNIVDKIKI